MPLSLNTTLQGRYHVVRQLGQGGMGAVYEAIDERLNSIVVIKESLVESEEGKRAFEREANLLANLRHASLPKVIDHFIENKQHFLVMEFIQGTDLAKLLKLRGRAFEPEVVIRWAEIILNVLDYLHKRNPPILHRDIKPANLKLDEDGELFLLDFGLAKGAAGQMPTLVTNKSVRGYTAVYASLEQIHGSGTDPRSDIYSLGATLYHLITGITPTDAPTRFNAIEEGRGDPLRPAHEVNPEVTPEISEIIKDATAVSRKERIASAADMRDALRGVNHRQADTGKLDEPVLAPTIISPPLVSQTKSELTLTETQKLQLEYWTAFRHYLEQKNSFLNPPKPQAQTWFPIPIGRSYFALEAYMQRKGRRICAYLILSGPDAKAHFHLLQRNKEAIQYEIGEQLEWREFTKGQQSQVFLCKHKTNPEDRQDWQAQHEWLKEKLELFHRVFAPRIKNLNASDYVSEIQSVEKQIQHTTIASPPIASHDISPDTSDVKPKTTIQGSALKTPLVKPKLKSKLFLSAIIALIALVIISIVLFSFAYQSATTTQNANTGNAVARPPNAAPISNTNSSGTAGNSKQTAEDSRIQETIRRKILSDKALFARHNPVRFTVINGEVTFTGTVKDSESKSRYEQLATTTQGVSGIHNEIVVSP